MSKKTIERAERAEKDRVKEAKKVQDKVDKTERDRVDKARKVQEKTDKTERKRVDKARKVQEKTDKTEKDRVDMAADRERHKVFDDFLSATAAKIHRCCEPCNYHVMRRGEYQPCKMGHDDSGPVKEFCADCSEPRYHPRPATG